MQRSAWKWMGLALMGLVATACAEGGVGDPAPSGPDQKAKVNPIAHVAWRVPHEKAVIKASTGAVRTAVVRPGIVYGSGRGIIGDMLKDANRGLVRVIGNGENHWPLVYDRDLGDLYARLIASPDAKGIYHANDEGDERVNDIVEAIREAAHVRPSLRLVATDTAWSAGAGAEVRGPVQALLLLLTGRTDTARPHPPPGPLANTLSRPDARPRDFEVIEHGENNELTNDWTR